MIEFNRVSKIFERKFLFKDLSFNFMRGKTLLVGQNGVGKTTLLSMIYGLVRPNAGKITCFGYDSVRDFKQVKKKIAYLPSDGQFPLTIKFKDVIEYAMTYTSENVISSYVERLGIGYLVHKQIKNMSSGEKRLCGIAFTLFSSKDFLIMDEPLVNVDRERQLIINEIIKSENRDIIMTAHHDEPFFSSDFHIIKVSKDKITGISEISSSSNIKKTIRLYVSDPVAVSGILKINSIDFSTKIDEIVLYDDPEPKVMGEIMKYIISFRRSVEY